MTKYLKTKGLMLRPLVPRDGPKVVTHLNDYVVSKWLASVPHRFTASHVRVLQKLGFEQTGKDRHCCEARQVYLMSFQIGRTRARWEALQ